MGFVFGFSAFNIMFYLVFVVIIIVFIVGVVKGLGTWSKNNRSPRLTVEAAVVSRRQDTDVHRHHHQNHGHVNTSTRYYATFQFESGDRLELQLPGAEYGMLVEGDTGELTFQGTRYLGFSRRSGYGQPPEDAPRGGEKKSWDPEL